MKIEKAKNLFQIMMLLPVIQTLEEVYPDAEHWFINKVAPRVMLGEDIVLVLKSDNGDVAGIAIGKKTKNESKLCCLKVMDNFQGHGYGIKLIKSMLKELGDDSPYCTVSEDFFHMYAPIFINHFGWSIDDVQRDLYKKGKLEYFFNGKMKESEML